MLEILRQALGWSKEIINTDTSNHVNDVIFLCKYELIVEVCSDGKFLVYVLSTTEKPLASFFGNPKINR